MNSIAFTGHRPKDLPAFATYTTFTENMDAIRKGREVRIIAGGALGVDTWAAEYAMSRHLPLDLMLPFSADTMSRFWAPYQRGTLDIHIAYAKENGTLTVIGGDAYEVQRYQERNEAMVNASDIVIAVWTGKKIGGTANCIRYALKIGKRVYNLFPFDYHLHPIKEA